MTKPSPTQRKLMKRFCDHSGFDFMGEDSVHGDDHQGFIDKWERNCRWLEDVAGDCRRMIYRYEAQHDAALAEEEGK